MKNVSSVWYMYISQLVYAILRDNSLSLTTVPLQRKLGGNPGLTWT